MRLQTEHCIREMSLVIEGLREEMADLVARVRASKREPSLSEDGFFEGRYTTLSETIRSLSQIKAAWESDHGGYHVTEVALGHEEAGSGSSRTAIPEGMLPSMTEIRKMGGGGNHPDPGPFGFEDREG